MTDEPVTREDLHLLAAQMKERLDRLTERVERLEALTEHLSAHLTPTP